MLSFMGELRLFVQRDRQPMCTTKPERIWRFVASMAVRRSL